MPLPPTGGGRLERSNGQRAKRPVPPTAIFFFPLFFFLPLCTPLGRLLALIGDGRKREADRKLAARPEFSLIADALQHFLFAHRL